MSDEIRNAVIQSTRLGIEDHGFTDAWLMLKLPSGGQGFGGYVLGAEGKPSVACGLFIRRCLEIAGVNRWEDLQGRPIRVRGDSGRIHAIGKLLEEEWFDPAKEFAYLRNSK